MHGLKGGVPPQVDQLKEAWQKPLRW